VGAGVGGGGWLVLLVAVRVPGVMGVGGVVALGVADGPVVQCGRRCWWLVVWRRVGGVVASCGGGVAAWAGD
jgi:hypothetical protein